MLLEHRRYEALRPATPLTAAQLLEMPQHYPGNVIYQSKLKFVPISRRNFGSHIVIGQDGFYTYVVDLSQTTGFVFVSADIESEALEFVPVMQLQLRKSSLDGLRQAFRLRIQEEHARKGIATTWYVLFAQTFGGIVSDFEHLEGGKNLWRAFVDKAAYRGLTIHAVDTLTGESVPVGPETSDDAIWSTDQSKRSTVLVLRRSAR